ncbi:hypothetical protein [Amycolatopsis aidingensis]|uniref:hypothetical protein n=1 Tax=Amycolatopsis aidingensis TaxID=2842453 RepID=UPI001E4E5B0B|nr:hypothetical protein [Amycolatopsis aidingensis]
MGELAERLDNIRVRVSAPGTDIEAELRNRTEFTLSFGESVYEFIDERALERALASLARLLYAGWQRQYREAISDTALNIDPEDQHDLDFRDESRAASPAMAESRCRRSVWTSSPHESNQDPCASCAKPSSPRGPPRPLPGCSRTTRSRWTS